MKSPVVSVIIPVYNASAFLKESLQSICNQSYQNLEIIVCDDASTDNSLQLASSIVDHRLIIMRNEKNIGYLRTVNKLFSQSTGRYIAFHDADDISHHRRIELQVEALIAHPEISLAGTNFNIIDPNGKILHCHLKQLTNPNDIREQLLERNVFQKPSILFHRKVWETIGGFREGFLKLKNISEDYDWLLRASEHVAMTNVNGDEPLYNYRSVTTAMSKGFTHVEQTFGHKIAQHLSRERKENGTDSMMREDWSSLDQYVQSLKIPYQADPSLFYYEKAESLLYFGLYAAAVRQATAALVRAPFKRRNIRCFAHAVKKFLF